jgi:hypothetical protein
MAGEAGSYRLFIVIPSGSEESFLMELVSSGCVSIRRPLVVHARG